MSLKNRLKKMEEAFAQLQGNDVIPPLFVSSYHKDKILGFRSGDNAVMRRAGEDIHSLEKRAVEVLRESGTSALMLVAITESWGNWPYSRAVPEDEWSQEVKKHYESTGANQWT